MADAVAPVRAVQYVRMSTDRQEYSIAYQVVANAAYARERSYQLVRTYSDAGISGLTLHEREGLKGLLADAISGKPDFSVILVYDVSRWGRFQNPDQAAHYEFLCSEAGVRIEYCAEPFENDGSPTSALLKHLKRAMAAEYSRELSEKVRRACREAAAQGYWNGGQPPLGLRVEMIDSAGAVVPRPSGNNWRKKLGTRTRLVWGSAEEVAMVRRMYRLYLAPGGAFRQIAEKLNSEGLRHPSGGPWTRTTVAAVLSNELYKGQLICGRWRHVLGSKRRLKMPAGDWIVNDYAVKPIVSPRVFAAVQAKRRGRCTPVSREAALKDLKRLVRTYQRLTEGVLAHGRWAPSVYQRLFGTMDAMRAAACVELPPQYVHLLERARHARDRRRVLGQVQSDEQILEGLRRLYAAQGQLTGDVILSDRSLPSPSAIARRFGGLSNAYALVGYAPEPLGIRLVRARAAQRKLREGRVSI